MINPLLRKLLSVPVSNSSSTLTQDSFIDAANSAFQHNNTSLSTLSLSNVTRSGVNLSTVYKGDSDFYDTSFYDGENDYFYGGDNGDNGCDDVDLDAIDIYLKFHTMVDVYANTAVGLLGIAANMIVIPILCRYVRNIVVSPI